MSRTRFEQNLQRMLQELQAYVSQENISVGDAARSTAEKIADKIYLAHSTSAKNFVQMCEDGASLLSPSALDGKGIKSLRADAVERILETSDFVFLYAGAFSFPSSSCGLLFARSLESDHPDSGSATPFDSGGLVEHFELPNTSETPRDFFRRHQLPLSEHRNYLSQCLGALFSDPFDYVLGNGLCHEGPIGLTGGDACRRSTHEVRIPDNVRIRNPHLQAVFAPVRMSLEPQVESLLKWCTSEGFDVVSFESDGDNDFAKMKTAWIEYLRTKLL